MAGVAQPATAGTPIGATQPPLWPTALGSAHKLERSGLAQDNFALRIPVAEVLRLWRQRVQVLLKRPLANFSRALASLSLHTNYFCAYVWLTGV